MRTNCYAFRNYSRKYMRQRKNVRLLQTIAGIRFFLITISLQFFFCQNVERLQKDGASSLYHMLIRRLRH